MSTSLSELATQVMQLPVRDRALLFEQLVASLETEGEVDVAEIWLQEAERRYQAYREGSVPARPAETVFQEAASRLK